MNLLIPVSIKYTNSILTAEFKKEQSDS